MKVKCKYQRGTNICDGLPVLKRLRIYSDIQDYTQTEENGPVQQLAQSISNGGVILWDVVIGGLVKKGISLDH